MARQDGTRVLHFTTGEGPICSPEFRAGLPETTNAREVTCGHCQRSRVWLQAWKDAAKVKAR